MTIQSPFSAVDSLTGYLFQVKYALFDAIRRLKDNDDFSVSIETLDDIVFENSGEPADLLQVKHHSKPANLTDSSVDLWKTVRIWIEQFNNGKINADTKLYLVTTSRASENSAAYYLKSRPDDRNIARAIDILDVVARSSTNNENLPAYEIFRPLSLEQKTTLFNCIEIIDSSPNILEIDSELRREILLVVDKKFTQQFLARLESWWYRRVLVHIAQDNQKAILSDEILGEIGNLREQFKQENLPIDEEIFRLVIDDAVYQDRIFVQQLKLIDVSTRRIFIAVRDYFRAFEQRSRWLRDELLEVSELDRYERQLIEDWEIHFEQMYDLLGQETTEAEKRKLSQELYAWVETGDLIRIRPQVSQPSLSRGSYHILSDNQVVGWHPEFKERLMQLLGA